MSESAPNVPELVSAVFEEAPAPLRIRLLECLVRPLGPLALVAIAGGAFAHLLYRLRRNAAPISPNDANRVTSEQVLELTNYVEQCSPDALLRIGALIADRPLGVGTMSGTALLTALGLENWQPHPLRLQTNHSNESSRPPTFDFKAALDGPETRKLLE